jgi:hypothetical protein
MNASACLIAAAMAWAEPAPVDFNREIRPILSETCYTCHGPDEPRRKAKLRLDTKDGAFKDLGGGLMTLVPGRPDESEVYQRILSDDPMEKMPPPDSGKSLTPAQVELVRRWIAEGAKWSEPWSLSVPKRPEVPAVAGAPSPIDAFIRAKLAEAGLSPSPEAPRAVLARRLNQDLLGLPPAAEEVDAFVADADPGAYEKLVDRLLASPHYGERMAMLWLDWVRYADTDGFHGDNYRSVWPYRDWVIDAFNANMPFDRFTVEQVAGDLIPGATEDQKIASGYNKLLMTTEEGGAQPKEYTAKYAADRVRNASTVWLGATLGCAECHDHKYDPLATKDFYSFAAFFADVKETPVGRQEPYPLPSPEQKRELEQLDAELALLNQALAAPHPARDAAQAAWEGQAKAKPDGLPAPVVEALKAEPAKRTDAQKQALADHFRQTDPAREPLRKAIAEMAKKREELVKQIPTSFVAVAMPPRTMRVLPRGNWLDDSGAEVQPGVPSSLGSLPSHEGRATRLDLGRWLAARENPRTARVFVNRAWKLLFGRGLVATLDDFGSQGAPPSHPELLDWLAVDFMESGWDVKRLIKQIAMSQAYRQSSLASRDLRERDPDNRLLARQGRFRVDAELVRDHALAIGGLLVPAVGGPSVKPYQPAGYWTFLNFPKREWENDSGDKLYRRGLYTFWCRTFLHPSLSAFDAPTREECTVDRPRTNTPLQALVLLNDPIYVEASRAFAERVLRHGGATDPERIAFAFRTALGRAPSHEEAVVLADLLAKHRAQFAADRPAAEAALKVGARPAPADLDRAELASWASLARAVLNLHETTTRN